MGLLSSDCAGDVCAAASKRNAAKMILKASKVLNRRQSPTVRWIILFPVPWIVVYSPMKLIQNPSVSFHYKCLLPASTRDTTLRIKACRRGLITPQPRSGKDDFPAAVNDVLGGIAGINDAFRESNYAVVVDGVVICQDQRRMGGFKHRI